MTTHLMLDLETMSTDPRAAIVQIGAATFTLGSDKLGMTFKASVSLRSAMDHGLVVDGDTVTWWLTQSKAAQDSLLVSRQQLPEALKGLQNFIKASGATMVWGNGSAFDCVITRSAFKACGMPSPWHYSNERDMRTFKDMALGLLGPSAIDAVAAVPRPKIEHDALEDAVYQVRVVQTLAAGLRALRKAAPTPKSEEEFP